MRVFVYDSIEAQWFRSNGWVLEYQTACAWVFVQPWPAPIFE